MKEEIQQIEDYIYDRTEIFSSEESLITYVQGLHEKEKWRFVSKKQKIANTNRKSETVFAYCQQHKDDENCSCNYAETYQKVPMSYVSDGQKPEVATEHAMCIMIWKRNHSSSLSTAPNLIPEAIAYRKKK